jgi:hypothetical protein
LPSGITLCIRSTTASLQHRLAAATLALIQADNHGDFAEAQSVFNAVGELSPTSDRQRIDFLTLSAIFHASFGDVSQVSTLLSDSVELTRRIQQPVLRASLLRRASWGLCRFGPRSLARDVLGEAISIFDRLSLPDQLTYCLEHLCVIDLQEADYPAVTQTLLKVMKLGAESSSFYSRAVEYEIRVRLAFETGSELPLKGFRTPSDALAPFARASRARLNIAALELGDRLVRQSDSDLQTALRVVSELQPMLKNRCDQDFVIAVMATAMMRLDRRLEAAYHITDYLTCSRRERDYILPSLVRIVGELGVTTPSPSYVAYQPVCDAAGA